MEFGNLKQSIEKIEMSDEMRNRIIQNCRISAVNEKEVFFMKNKEGFKIRRVALIAAVIALCLCASVAAADQLGAFEDVKNWAGTVTGTGYVRATEEIEVTAAAEQGVLTITTAFLAPDAAPYSEFEMLEIESYKIVDAAGDVVASGKGEGFAGIADGKAEVNISLDGVETGDYKLLISSFVGTKKADQPLKISGSWECGFVVD